MSDNPTREGPQGYPHRYFIKMGELLPPGKVATWADGPKRFIFIRGGQPSRHNLEVFTTTPFTPPAPNEAH